MLKTKFQYFYHIRESYNAAVCVCVCVCVCVKIKEDEIFIPTVTIQRKTRG